MSNNKNEEEYYEPVKRRLESLFKDKVEDVYLEKTPDAKFSQSIKEKIPENRGIIFSFLTKGNAPDITGFIQKDSYPNFIVA